MTNEKLLEKINKLQYSDYKSWGSIPEWPYKALRAVVELHRISHIGLFCDGCARFVEPHPCPTIQAIEKELG